MKNMHMSVEWARKYSWLAMVVLFKKITIDGLVIYYGLKPPAWTDSRTFHVGRFNHIRIFLRNLSNYIDWLFSWIRFKRELYPRYPRHRIEIKTLLEKYYGIQLRFLQEDLPRTLKTLDLQYSLVFLRGDGKKFPDKSWSGAKAKGEKLTWEAELDAFQAWLEKAATEFRGVDTASLDFYQSEVIHKKAAELLGIPSEMLEFPEEY